VRASCTSSSISDGALAVGGARSAQPGPSLRPPSLPALGLNSRRPRLRRKRERPDAATVAELGPRAHATVGSLSARNRRPRRHAGQSPGAGRRSSITQRGIASTRRACLRDLGWRLPPLLHRDHVNCGPTAKLRITGWKTILSLSGRWPCTPRALGNDAPTAAWVVALRVLGHRRWRQRRSRSPTRVCSPGPVPTSGRSGGRAFTITRRRHVDFDYDYSQHLARPARFFRASRGDPPTRGGSSSPTRGARDMLGAFAPVFGLPPPGAARGPAPSRQPLAVTGNVDRALPGRSVSSCPPTAAARGSPRSRQEAARRRRRRAAGPGSNRGYGLSRSRARDRLPGATASPRWRRASIR